MEDERQSVEPVPCFFCGKNLRQKDSVCVVPMFKVVKTTGRVWGAIKKTIRGGLTGFLPDKTVVYSTRKIHVPRCNVCRGHHDRQEEWERRCLLAAGAAGAVLGIVLAIYLQARYGRGGLGSLLIGLLFLAFMGACGGLFIGHGLTNTLRSRSASGHRPLEYQQEFPPVQKAVAEGWELGEKPVEKYGTSCVEVLEEIIEPDFDS